MRKLDLIGKQFDKLLVVEFGGIWSDGKGVKRRTMWKCKCSCGNKNLITVIGSNLTRGNSISCGCKTLFDDKYNSVNLLNKKFGSLTVIDKCNEKTKSRGVFWLCRCDCGKETKVTSNSLTSGNTQTCGSKNKHPKLKSFCGEISLNHINSIRQNAIKRNLEFKVTPEFLWDLFLKQNRKCFLSGIELYFSAIRKETTASLDRIDNKEGYIDTNVRWVHKQINIMRSDCDDEEFLNWCELCIKNNNENNKN